MPISLLDYLKGLPINELPISHQQNAVDLLKKVNNLLQVGGVQGLVVTSGYRTQADHLRIYSKRILENKEWNLTHPNDLRHDHFGIPMKSRHLSGQAVDIGGAKIKELQAWCLANEAKLAEIGLWMEDFATTKNWIHFQSVPPASGKRWFKP